MIKPRLIVLLTLLDGVLFRTKRFRPDYRYTSNFVGTTQVDEVVAVDVGTDRAAFLAAARAYADRCFSPLTMGGKVRDAVEVDKLFRDIGADKVLFKWNHPLIPIIARRWGRQAAVAGVDYSRPEDAVPFAKAAEDAGAGEILLTSIERDGSLQGYDLPTLESVVRAVSVPVVASGGCGGWFHVKQAFEAGASGAATSVIHHFTETSLAGFKANLTRSGVAVRP